MSGAGMAGIPVLMYHSIAGRGPRGMDRLRVTPAEFGEQLDWLAASGHTTVTISRLAAAFAGAATLPARPVVLTFDDGFADFYHRALPMLEQRGMVATLYVTTGYLRHDSAARPGTPAGWPQTMTWRQVAQLPARGIEVGGHTHTHPQLDLVSPTRAGQELALCKSQLEDCTGQEVTSLAYPYGYSTAQVRSIVRATGYTSACAVKHALTCDADDPYALSRVEMTGTTTVAALAGWIGGGLRAAPCPDRLRSRGWSAVRRLRHRLGTHHASDTLGHDPEDGAAVGR